MNKVEATLGGAEFEFAKPTEDIPADRSFDAAAAAPRETVLNAWLEIESALNGLADSRGLRRSVASGTPLNGSALLKRMANEGILPTVTTSALLDMLQLRNLAAHASQFNPSPSEVVQYAAVAQHVVRELRRMTQDPNATYSDISQ